MHLSGLGLTGFFAGLCLLAFPAGAHPAHGDKNLRISGLEPPAANIRVRAVPGSMGRLTLSAGATENVMLFSNDAIPVFRIGPQGVEANRNAPDWYRFNEPLGIAQVPEDIEHGAEHWVLISRLRSWSWFEHRAHPAGDAASDWQVPLLISSQPTLLRGHLAPAGGHLELGQVTVPQLAGLTIAALNQPVPALQLRNKSDRVVSIMGTDGEEFARIGPGGVSVNVHSPVWAIAAQYSNRSLLESVIDPVAAPQFVLLSKTPELTWPDPRLLPAELSAAPWKWEIPLQWAAASEKTAAPIRGLTELKPDVAEKP